MSASCTSSIFFKEKRLHCFLRNLRKFIPRNFLKFVKFAKVSSPIYFFPSRYSCDVIDCGHKNYTVMFIPFLSFVHDMSLFYNPDNYPDPTSILHRIISQLQFSNANVFTNVFTFNPVWPGVFDAL